MKRLCFLVLSFCLVIIFLSGCSFIESLPASASEDPPIDYTSVGNGVFESSLHGIRFRYPAEWAELSAAVLSSNPDSIAAFESLLGLSEPQLQSLLDSATVYLYNPEEIDPLCVSNLSLMCSETTAISSDQLTNEEMLEQLKISFEERYTPLYAQFSWARQPCAETYGTVSGVYLSFTYGMGSENIVCHQFVTANNGTLYTFTHMSSASFSGNSLVPLLDIFTSIEYL